MNAVSLCFSLVIEEKDINNNKDITEKDLIDYCCNNECVRFYALIKHDKDINEDGEKIRNHYHLVIYLTRAFSKNTILGDIVRTLSINKLIVSIRVGDIIDSVCYLTHNECKGNKHKYSSLDIKTNDIYNLNSILSQHICLYVLSIDYLIGLVSRCSSLSEIYSILGLKDAKLYRSIVLDLWKEYHISNIRCITSLDGDINCKKE